MSRSPRMRARLYVGLTVLSVLGACNSHPLGTRKPQVVIVNPPAQDVRTTADAGATDVRLVVDPRVPDARDATEVQSPDVRGGIEVRSPDVTEVRQETKDLAADRYQAPGDVPDAGSGLELVSWVQSIGGTPIRVLKQNQVVYLGDWANHALAASGDTDQGSIQSYDVREPILPVLMSTVFTPGQEMQDMVLERRWLYAANDLLGLRLVDIAQPDSLRSVTNWVRPSSGSSRLYATSVAVTTRGVGDARQVYAFVGYLYGGGLDIHLVPEGGPIPDPIHYSSTALPSRCDINQIQIQGDRAYLLASNGDDQMVLEILDLSPLPEIPTVLGRLSLPMREHGGIGDIRVSGDLLYFSSSTYAGASGYVGGLRIINVADVAHPVLVGRLDFSPAGNIAWKGTGLALADHQAFCLTSAGVLIIDVSTPASPKVQALAPFPSVFRTCQGGTAVLDADLLYVGAYCEPPNGLGGLAIYRRR